MRETFLPFSPPFIGEEEVVEVVAALRSGWITTGPRTKAFEDAFAKKVGAEAALALFSGTDAMQVALAALGIGSGDEVITTTMTFCATAHVIEHVGATPVLVDVEPDTLNIDPAAVERAVTPRTKAVMPVHLYGHPCEMDAILAVAGRHGLHVVEDAAHALPASYKGRPVGSIGDATAFSFYATKNLTTAEGGMMTGSRELVDKARVLSLHGMSRDAWKRYSAEGSWRYDVVAAGFKCNMTDLQAAIGLRQLDRLAAMQARRDAVVRRYDAAFSALLEVELPTRRLEVDWARHIYALRLNLDRLTIGRDRFIEEMKARNIGASVHFIPIHSFTYYRDRYGYRSDDFPVASREFGRLVSIPLNPTLADADVDDVVDAVTGIVEAFRR